jgi:hypothetical protein
MSHSIHERNEVLKCKFTHIRSGRTAVAVVTLAAGCLIAACGSASSSGNSTSSTAASASSSRSSSAVGGATGSARRTQLVACLKSHGVTLPSRRPGSGPPPGGGAGGGGTGTGTGTSTTPRRNFFFGGGARNISPKMQAAFKACGAQFGFRGGAGGFRGRLSHTAITKYVTCVRQHGYKLPNPNFSGKGPIFPANIQSNAKFQGASKACQNLLIPPRPSGGTSTTSGA